MGISLEDLASAVAAGNRPALARALSLAERDPAATAELLRRLGVGPGRAHVIGITGPPGAGKSTLVGVLLRRFLEAGRRVAVLAVDPSSPLSGGALLGDRFRIGEAADDRSFVRSTATRGCLGGLTAAARQMVDLMEAAGFDLVIVETVGTGQSEVDVARLADSLLVVFPPGLGDEMQAIKAGVLELADMLVVSKCDTAGASLACQALQAVAPLWRSAPTIHAVSALTGEGIGGLAEALLARAAAGLPARRCAERVGKSQGFALADEFSRLRALVERRLPFAVGGEYFLSPADAAVAAPDAGLLVVYRLGAAGDAFRLGAVAGAFMVLAAEAGLGCRVEQVDSGAGTVRLVLHHAA